MKIKAHHGVPLLLLSAAISDQVFAAAVAVDDFAPVAVDSSIDIDVLANDTVDSLNSGSGVFLFEPDGEGTKLPDNGQVVIGQNNTLIYTPNPGFVGTDTFEYEVQDTLDYGSDIALVTVTVSNPNATGEGPIESSVIGESNQATAAMLDNFCLAPSDELRTACAELETLAQTDPAALNTLVSQITPDEVLTQRRMVAEVIRNQTQRLYSSRQLMMQGIGVGALGSNTLLLNSYSGGNAGEGLPQWALFGSIKFGKTDHDQTSRESGYDADTTGMLVGVNYRLRPNLDVGMALDFTDYSVDYNYDAGGLDSEVYSLNGFASWAPREQISLDLTLGYSMGDISTKRYVQYTQANGDTNSSQYFLSAQAQYTFHSGAFNASPYLRLEYVSASVDGYSETGNNPWLMNVAKQDLDQVNYTLGVDTTYALSFDWGVMVPGLKLSAISEGNQDYSPVAFSLVNNGGSDTAFILRPDGEDSLYYQIEANSVFVMQGGFSTYISVQTLAGYENVDAWLAQAGFNYEL